MGVPEAYLSSYSSDVNLKVEEAPYGTIKSFVCPDWVVVGKPIEMGVLVENTGGDDRDFQVSIWDEYASPEPKEVARSSSIHLAPGEQAWFYFAEEQQEPPAQLQTLKYGTYPPPYMPDREVLLTAHALHYIPWFKWGWDGSAQHTVKPYVEVATSLTLSIEPIPVDPGETYKYKGRLTRTDTGEGLAGMEIICYRGSTEVGRTTTDSTGNYELSATAPDVVGTYTCRSYFAGSFPFLAVKATSALEVSTTALPEISPLKLVLVGLGALSAGAVAYKVVKK